MKTFKHLALASACILALAGSESGYAQSTDGYHTIQVFPLVVDSASFAQRFVFRNPDPDTTITIIPKYFPGEGTSQVDPLDCPSFTVAPDSARVFGSLREICSDLPDGSQPALLFQHFDHPGISDAADARPFENQVFHFAFLGLCFLRQTG